MFAGSLKINLDPFESFNEAELWDVLEKTHLKDFVMTLEGQLLFECVEGGENLR